VDVEKGYDIFSLVINFLGVYWQPKHIATRCFEASDTFGHALTNDLLTNLLVKYDSKKNINVHVKNEGSNLSTMTINFSYVVSCNVLGFKESFQGSYFDHDLLICFN
jgi:hypothetical protein